MALYGGYAKPFVLLRPLAACQKILAFPERLGYLNGLPLNGLLQEGTEACIMIMMIMMMIMMIYFTNVAFVSFYHNVVLFAIKPLLIIRNTASIQIIQHIDTTLF